MKEQIVAFLDLLAFSNHVRENTEDALLAFTTYRAILETKITDDLVHPPQSYSNPILQDLATKHGVSSFKYFLPFSDSIFIASDDPDVFIHQLGAFVLHCFTFTSHEYLTPDDPDNPTKVIRSGIISDATGKAVNYKNESNLYPTLFRGGIANGEAYPIELMGIVNGNPQKIANLAGKAVVKAVGLESKIKGPRIIFEKVLYDKLSDKTKVYVSETEIKGYFEVLWPAFLFIPANGANELNDFYKLAIPAINFWKAYNHTPFAEHYFKFIELVVKSTVQLFEHYGFKENAIKKVAEIMAKHGIENKVRHLLN